MLGLGLERLGCHLLANNLAYYKPEKVYKIGQRMENSFFMFKFVNSSNGKEATVNRAPNGSTYPG